MPKIRNAQDLTSKTVQPYDNVQVTQNKGTRLWKGDIADEEVSLNMKDASQSQMNRVNTNSRNFRLPDAYSLDQINRAGILGTNKEILGRNGLIEER